jgi:3'(2'), 5'-bisphosphate nucleotidase
MQTIRHHDLLEALLPLAREAGDLIMGIYAQDFAVTHKADASPVTQADTLAEEAIVRGLRKLAPAIPVVAEEAVSEGQAVTTGERFWLVDPLDGTREFINRNGEFTVNIALIEHGEPVLGVVLAPALGRLYAGARGAGGAAGAGAFREAGGQRAAIACRPPGPNGLVVVASRSHGDAEALDRFLAGRRVARLVQAGSSLKLCLLAEGEADLYPRLGRTMEWDIAAGHAVLAAAGGRVVTLDGQPLRYGKPGLENPHFAAWGHGA